MTRCCREKESIIVYYRWNVYDEARKSSQKNDVPEMTLEEINAVRNGGKK